MVSLRGTGEASLQVPSPVEKTTHFSAFRVVCSAALAGAAAAVAGRRGRSIIARKAWNKEAELGAQEPLGFWDPLGFCEDEEKFKDFRAKEIKHGRLAMMGALGMLAQSVVQVPGMEGVPK